MCPMCGVSHEFQYPHLQIVSSMDSNKVRAEASPLPFLHLIQTLKHIPRTGWLMKIENPESVASHSFRVAFLGLLAPVGLTPFCKAYSKVTRWQPPLDSKECMFIGLCHDLGKAIIGDMPKATRVPRGRWPIP